jgi:energy-coupling factor transporter ATP-binding protein EcfA2
MITRVKHTLAGGQFAADLGPVTALIGPNGSGKTTVLNAIQFALTGRLALPMDGRQPAKSNQDLADLLMAPGASKADVTVECGGAKNVYRKISRNKKGKVSIDVSPENSDYPTLDPLAYSLASWLEQTGPQRVKEMLEYAAIRKPTAAELPAGLPSFLTVVAQNDSAQTAIDALHQRIVALQQEKQQTEKRIAADHEELLRAQAVNRPKQEIVDALDRGRARLAEIEGELKATEARLVDHAEAVKRLQKAQADAAKATSALATAGNAAEKARAELRGLSLIKREPVPLDDLLIAVELLEDELAEAQYATNVAAAIRNLGAELALCDKCRALVDGLAAKAATSADPAVIALRLDKARRDLDTAKIANAKIPQQIEMDKAAAANCQRIIDEAPAYNERRKAAVEALADAQRDVERLAPGEHVDQLRAEKAGLLKSIAADEAALEKHRGASTLDARIIESRAKVDALEKEIAESQEHHAALLALRDKLLADSLAPLNSKADAIYHGVTGGHVLFNSERGGVDLVDKAGTVIPLEAASVGERALAFPAISIALQQARGHKATILLDGLESLDRRLDLLELCAGLVKSGQLEQVICNWTSSPDIVIGDNGKQTTLATIELALAERIDGVTAIKMGGDA